MKLTKLSIIPPDTIFQASANRPQTDIRPGHFQKRLLVCNCIVVSAKMHISRAALLQHLDSVCWQRQSGSGLTFD